MSYIRFGEDNSDVYIFLNVYGYLECCGCSLIEYKMEKRSVLGIEGTWPTAQEHYPRFETVKEMVEHLNRHKEEGQCVPDSCFEELERDKEHIEKFCKETTYESVTNEERDE